MKRPYPLRHPITTALISMFVATLSSGCAKQEFKTALVSGQCTCKGEPMTAGLLILAPVDESGSDKPTTNLGKPAQALIQSDGSFTMSTYGKDDGAVVGKHRVVLNLAVLDEDDPKQPCLKVAKDLIVEVEPGGNDLEIDLAGK